MKELHAKLRSRLEQSGIPHEEVRVFGTIRSNIHVRCVGENTAQQWAHLLGRLFPHVGARVLPTAWEAQENTGSCLRPTMRKGWLVSVIGA